MWNKFKLCAEELRSCTGKGLLTHEEGVNVACQHYQSDLLTMIKYL